MTAFSKLPESICAGGVEIPIHTDFRASIAFECIMQDSGVSEENRVEKILEAYFDESALPVIESVCGMGKTDAFFDAVLSFYRCGEVTPHTVGDKKRQPVAYSFIQDEKRIYAAFLEQYGVDLYKIPYLHWWKFSAMFLALSETTEISRIMRIRTAEPDKHMSAKERAALRRAKAAYALPDNRTPEEKDADFADTLSILF